MKNYFRQILIAVAIITLPMFALVQAVHAAGIEAQVKINSDAPYTTSATVTMSLACTDLSGSGCDNMQISNDYSTLSAAPVTARTAAVSWTLSGSDGLKTVFVKFQDVAGTRSSVHRATINLAAGGMNWIKVSAGAYHTVAINSDGTLWAWGDNRYGALGNGTINNSNIPVQIGSETTWVSVSTGHYYTEAIKSDGTLWAWGWNLDGRLGDGTTINRLSPVQIGLDTTWTTVSAGNGYTEAIKSDGSLWAWGYNGYGQFGNGTTNAGSYFPLPVGSETTWASVSAGDALTVAIKTDGTLWSWGPNWGGNLGNGTSIGSNVPVQVGSDTKWVTVSTWGFFAVAVKSDGTLWAWGANLYGQLGNGSTIDSNIPVQIGTDTNWVSAVAGYYHATAVKSDGSLWAWGRNNFGQLGNGSTLDVSSPNHIGSASNWVTTSAGFYHTASIKSDGSLLVWGDNTYGQIGNGTNGYSKVPVLAGQPRVTVTTPADGATGVLVSAPVSATFSWGMDSTSINSGSFTLTGPSGAVTGAMAYNTISKTATFTPSASLAYGSNYTATVTTGAKDLSGNALAANVSWSFTTHPAPVIYPLPFNESFSSGTLPNDWSLVSGRFGDWQINASRNYDASANKSVGINSTAELLTPILNMSGAAKPTLEFKTSYLGSGDSLSVKISLDGINWVTEWSGTGNSFSETTISRDLSSIAANKSNVIIKFSFTAGDGGTSGNWTIDDVHIYSACSGTLDKKQLSSPFKATTTGTIAVTSSGCTWTAISNSPWIAIDSGTSGTGNGTVGYTILPGTELVGSITVADQKIPVMHSGPGGLDAAFAPPDDYLTTAGSSSEKVTILRPSNSTFFYKISVENGKYTVQRRNNSDGKPLHGLGDGTIAGSNPGFDLQGRVTLPTDATDSVYPTKAIVQSDGKIVVFGYPVADGKAFELFRLNVNGSLDTSFGSGGYRTELAAIQFSDGYIGVYFDQIIVAVNDGGYVRVMQFSVDATSIGWSFTPPGPKTYLYDMKVLYPGGTILLAGNTGISGWLMRLKSDGTVDTAFGDIVSDPVRSGFTTFSNGYLDGFYAVEVQSDGRIIVAGESGDADGTGFLSVLRYTSVGALDTTAFAASSATPGLFLHGGADIGCTNFCDYGDSIAVQPNGKIVIGGAEWNSSNGSAASTQLRLKSDGTIDSVFGNGGVSTFGYLSGWLAGDTNSISLLADGKLLTAGYVGTYNVTMRQTGGFSAVWVTPSDSYTFPADFLPLAQSVLVKISNDGDAPLNVSNIALTGPVEFSLALTWSDSNDTCYVANPILNPGEFCNISVGFHPTAAGTSSSTLTVTSDNPDKPSVNLIISGDVLADNVAPTDGIGSLSATPGNANVVLTWPVAWDAGGIASYKVVYATGINSPTDCSGAAIYNGPGLTFTHFDLSPGSYSYRVCAVDKPGNISSGLIATATVSASTTIVSWKNPVSGNWNVAGNWNTGIVPTSSSDVVINLAGPYTVTLDTDTSVNSLVVGGAGVVLNVANPATANALTVNTTTRINSGAALTLSNSTLNQSGAFMSGGAITIGTGATLHSHNQFTASTLTGTGVLYFENSPGADFSTPFTIDRLQLYSSSVTIPAGSVIGTLDLPGGSTVMLGGDLDTAVTTITGYNSTINGPGIIRNNATLGLSGMTINSALVNAGTINTSSYNYINGTLTTLPGSVINVSYTGMKSDFVVADSFTNNGIITIYSNTPGPGYSPSTLTVTNGSLTNSPSGSITSMAGFGESFVNAQLINLGGVTANQNTYIGKSGAAHINSGTTTVASGSTLAFQKVPKWLSSVIQKGTFTNTGTLQGGGTIDLSTNVTFVSNDGFINAGVGITTGKLSILGTLPDTGNAVTNIVIGGNNVGSGYGQIAVSGSADLAGKLNVSLYDFYPGIGDRFTVMTCGTSCNGWFNPINYDSPGPNLSWQDFGGQDWNLIGAGGTSAGQADYTSLAFAPDGTPYLVYADSNNSSMASVMKYSNSVWSAVGSAFSAGSAFYTSIAIGADGLPYVAYQDGGASNKVTVKKYDGWSTWSDVGNIPWSTSIAYYTSLKVSPDGTPYLAYVDDNAGIFSVKVKKFSNNVWSPVGGSLAADRDTTSLVFASDGSLYLAYRGDSSQSNQSQVVRFDGSSNWLGVGSGGASAGGASYNSLAIAPDGTPYLAYRDESKGNTAMVRKFDGSSWVDVLSPSALSVTNNAATSISLAVAADGTPYLAYSDWGNSRKATSLRYDGTYWNNVGNLEISSGSTDYISLATSNVGTPFIAYADLYNGSKATVKSLQGAVTLNVTFTLSPTTLPDGAYGIAYNQTVIAKGGTGPYSYNVAGGALPTGLTLDSASGAISGTPTATGSFSFTIRALDPYNYVEKAFSIAINKSDPGIIEWPTAADITYGQNLASSTLSGGSAAQAGTFAWTSPTTAPVAGSGSQSVTFTPSSPNYASATDMVSVKVAKANPVISTWPTATAITYGQTLASSTLSGGITVPSGGSFTFTAPITAPGAGTSAHGVDYTPTDTANYNSVTGSVSVTVAKATPVITWTAPASVYVGSTLSATQLNATSDVAGSFSYTPALGTLLNTVGTQALTVDFTPTDANYNTQSSSVNLVVTDKIIPTITWGTPADITYSYALSATQLNATSTVAGTFVYSPASGTFPNVGSQTLAVTFTPKDTITYASQTASVTLTVNPLPAGQITTGADGQIMVQMTLSPATGASMTLNPGTFLTDADGQPISGTLTVAASVMNGAAALSGLVPALAQTPDGKILSSLGSSIDITISAGAAKVKNINPAMIVNLKVSASFAAPGATVSYYSFDGAAWHLEGTAIVKPDGSVDMSVSHLSVWAIASFASVVDASAPVVSLTLPPTSATLAVSGITVVATDDIGVTGYLLSESATAPLSTDSAWNTAIPTSYTFKTWGNCTLYAYAKDAVGNVSVKSASILIGSKDGIVVPAADGEPAKVQPGISDALKSLNFAMEVEIPTAADVLHGDVAPLVNGVPQPDGKINLGDTIVILRRVVGL